MADYIHSIAISLFMKYLYYWVLLGCFSLTTAYSQCLVSYLPLNTGFNPTQYTPLSAGTTSAPIHDHYWGTDSATSSISGSLVGSGAYVIQRYSAWAMAPGTQPSNWLSCVNSNGYTINGNGSTAYNMVLGRSFRLCSADSVRVSLRIANDNYISRIDIDGTTVLSFAQSAGRTAGNYDSFTAFTQVIYLPAGTHRLHIKCHNFNDSAGFNYAGLCIYGSVSSATGKP
ncbi:MAG: hypothetical protein EBX41_04935, partial [Chitinophagia bacterium]|nr:hypothetical protein [Chitinophagia bacterium]